VPIEDDDAMNLSQCLRPADGDGNVAEDAKAASDVARGVMAGRPRHGVDVIHGSVENSFYGRRAKTRSKTNDVVGIRPDPGAFSDITATFFADRPNLRNVLGRITAQ